MSLSTWVRAKVGRLVTGLGVLLSGVESFDITPIKDPLESLITHQGVQVVTVLLFLASFARHQMVANQHKSPPPPDDGK